MFQVNEDKSIFLTRGDIAVIDVSASADGGEHFFSVGDVIRFKVFGKENTKNVLLSKDTSVTEETAVVTISLTGKDTKIGGLINKPTDYWYEVELNPDSSPQTLIGYDEDGAKILKLFPEGGDA